MQIKVKEGEHSECSITSTLEVGEKEQYVIKALCMLQLMCINSDEDKDKFEEFIDIIDRATDEAKQLFPEKERIENGTEQFKL